MSRSNRLCVIAARGFLIGGILYSGVALGQTGEPESKAPESQPTAEQPAPVKPVPPPIPAKQPISPEQAKGLCDTPQNREERDLCQQWRMAEAAEKQANWTKRQFWVTVAEVIGLLAVVVFTAVTARAANRSAKAAEDAVKVTSDTAKHQLRAFVFGNGFELGLSIWDGTIRDYIVFVKWENAGLTPATDVQSWVRFVAFPMNEDREITFTKPRQGPPTVLGPRSTAQSGYVTIPLQTVMEKWQRQTEILVWARVEYRDTFEPDVVRHHEQCSILEVIHDPSDIPPRDHPSYVTFSVYGPQNTTG